MSAVESSPTAPLSWPAAAFDWLGTFVFRYRDYLVPAVALIAIALTRPQAPFGSERLDRWLDVLGILIAAAGQAVRVTVIGYAYVQRGGANKRLSAPRLVSEGFYGHCRNPMYVGNILLLLGITLIYNSIWVYAILFPILAFAIFAIVRAEERFLIGRFGAEYEDYCRRVPRFVPRLRGLRQTLGRTRFDWRRVVRKEYGTTFAWLSAALLLMAWERIVRLGWDAAAPQLGALAALYVPVLIAYGTVRWLKKTQRLRSPDYVTL